MMAWWLVVALGLAPGSEVPIQRPSDPVPLVLDWQAPPSCPAREQVLERVRVLLPSLPDEVPTQGSALLRAHARVVAEAGALRVDLELSGIGGESERRFAAASCEEAAEATALIVAVTLDPVAVATEVHRNVGGNDSRAEHRNIGEEDPRAAEGAPETVISGPAEPSTPLSTTPDVRESSTLGESSTLRESSPLRPPRVGLRAFATGGFGPTRTGYAGVGGSVSLIGRLWRWEVAAAWSIPRIVLLADGTGGRFDAWSIGSRGCFVPVARRLELPLCPGFELGSVRGSGVPPTPAPTQASFLWLAAVLGQGIAWAPIDRLALGAELSLQVPLTRGSFVIGEREVDRLALVGARLLLGLEVRLP